VQEIQYVVSKNTDARLLVADACGQGISSPSEEKRHRVAEYISSFVEGGGNPLVMAKLQLGEFYLQHNCGDTKLQNLDKIILFHRLDSVVEMMTKKYGEAPTGWAERLQTYANLTNEIGKMVQSNTQKALFGMELLEYTTRRAYTMNNRYYMEAVTERRFLQLIRNMWTKNHKAKATVQLELADAILMWVMKWHEVLVPIETGVEQDSCGFDTQAKVKSGMKKFQGTGGHHTIVAGGGSGSSNGGGSGSSIGKIEKWGRKALRGGGSSFAVSVGKTKGKARLFYKLEKCYHKLVMTGVSFPELDTNWGEAGSRVENSKHKPTPSRLCKNPPPEESASMKCTGVDTDAKSGQAEIATGDGASMTDVHVEWEEQRGTCSVPGMTNKTNGNKLSRVASFGMADAKVSDGNLDECNKSNHSMHAPVALFATGKWSTSIEDANDVVMAGYHALTLTRDSLRSSRGSLAETSRGSKTCRDSSFSGLAARDRGSFGGSTLRNIPAC
jgi:hypothetical protein